MNTVYAILILGLILYCYLSAGQRRVINGKRADKRYVVYLLSPKQEHQPDPEAWLCGGAIITPKHVITTSGCGIFNWKLIWIIAGYNKYVEIKNVLKDPCTSRYKKQFKSFHVANEKHTSKIKLNYYSNWNMHPNLAIGEVDTPYNFHDVTYLKFCSYVPNAIQMNFREENIAPGVDAIVYGWGSNKYYRPESSSVNLNQPYLMGSSVLMNNMSACKAILAKHGKTFTDPVCSLGPGNIDIDGTYLGDQTGHDAFSKPNLPDYKNLEQVYFDPKFWDRTAQNGFCQNDQGGPLVTWVGGVEYLIGIATRLVVNSTMHCIGPFLYATVKTAQSFINCTLSDSSRRSSQGDCSLSTVQERDDEPIRRPQIPYT